MNNAEPPLTLQNPGRESAKPASRKSRYRSCDVMFPFPDGTPRYGVDQHLIGQATAPYQESEKAANLIVINAPVGLRLVFQVFMQQNRCSNLEWGLGAVSNRNMYITMMFLLSKR